MLIIAASPYFVAPSGKPIGDLVKVLTSARAAGNPVGLVSNQMEPPWFKAAFGASGVQFLRSPGRQNGKILSENAKKFQLRAHDVLVLAAKAEDVQMGKNGGAVLVAASWSADAAVQALGIKVTNAIELQEVIQLSSQWTGQWWFTGNGQKYGIRALADLSGYNRSMTQQEFGLKVTQTVKNGGARLNALLAVTARSLLTDGLAAESKLVWGVFPSSRSTNDDHEVLSDFTHRLRTTVSRVQFAKLGQPLFIRHTHSAKRSAGQASSRTDPAEQVQTLHLNPFYKESNRLVGKHVIVIDDVTTYGLSFGVASALLRKAGASNVTGVALGKFGNQLRYYNIDIQSDPFAPIARGGYAVGDTLAFGGQNNAESQGALINLIP